MRNSSSVISNVNIYLAIADQALSEALRLEAEATKPRGDGKPGFIMMSDPDSKSFKQSIIAVVFAGMFLDALLYQVGVQRFGKAEYMKLDRKRGTTYEGKLVALGVTDQELLATCKRVREARNDLMHERAVEIHEIGDAPVRWAQEEAKVAVMFVKSVAAWIDSAKRASQPADRTVGP